MPVAQHEHLTVSQSPPGADQGAAQSSRVVAVVALIALSIVCYSNVLAGYFYADDFPILRFLATFHESGAEIFKTIFFTRVPDFQPFLYCYRPLPDLFWLATYLVNGADPFWFHVLNIALHATSSVLVFLIAEELLAPASHRRLISFVAAAAFATCPVYGEVIHGAMNAVTGTCAVFFLTCVYFYLRAQYRMSVLAFACALLCKEVAAILPAVLAAIYWKRERKSPLRNIAPFLLVLAAYLAVRVAVLGPIIGGYTGALGDLNAEDWCERFFSPWPLYLLLPLHPSAFAPLHPLKFVLGGLYVALGVLIRKTRNAQSSAIQICALWLIATIIPVLPVWNTEAGLSGGRHGYIAASALFIAAALLTFNAQHKRIWCALWGSIIALFCFINIRNNDIYVEASQQALLLKQAVQMQAREPILLVNAPFQWKGLYIFPTSDMVTALCGERIRLPNEWLNGNYNLFSRELLPTLGAKAFSWDSQTCTLNASKLRLGSGMLSLDVQPVYTQRNQYGQVAIQRYLAEPALLDLETDFVEFRLTCSRTPRTAYGITPAASVWWQTPENPQFDPANTAYMRVIDDGKPHIYRIPLTDSVKSLLNRHNGCFEIRLPSPAFTNQLDRVKLLGWRHLAPHIELKSTSPCEVIYDAQKVDGAARIVLEVSKPESLLEHGLARPNRNYDSGDHASLRIFRSAPAGSVRLDLREPGVYEIEVGTIDKDGNPGYFSDPVFVKIARNPNNTSF